MPDMVYTEFPGLCNSGSTVLETVAGTSGKLHTVVISSQSAGSTQGSVTLKDASRTIQIWGTGTAANSFLFDIPYAAPLTIQTSSASDYVTVSAGPT